MSDFRECPRCHQIAPIFNHDCHVGHYQLIPATTPEPDPRDALYRAAAAHIAELTADRDRLAAEVDRLRGALEKYAALEGWSQGGQTGVAAYTWAREALAAVEHKQDYATANAPQNAPRDAESAKQDAPANEPVTNCGATSPSPDPTEHAALLRVAEAAEKAIEGHGPFLTPTERAIENALAELRRARNGGSDE